MANVRVQRSSPLVPGLPLVALRTLAVQGSIVIELKSVEEIKGIHAAQLLTYMKLGGVKTGLLINFNVTRLKEGIRRFVH